MSYRQGTPTSVRARPARRSPAADEDPSANPWTEADARTNRADIFSASLLISMALDFVLVPCGRLLISVRCLCIGKAFIWINWSYIVTVTLINASSSRLLVGAGTVNLLSQATQLAKDEEDIRKGLTLYREGTASVGPDKTPQDGLLAAARVGDAHAIKQHIARGVNPDLSYELLGETALCTAAARGHRAVVRLLLNAAAHVDMADRAGWTPLMWAASHGHRTVLRLLLETGASAIARGDGGKTALELAAVTGKVGCVCTLEDWSAGSLHEHRAAGHIQARQRGRSARRRRRAQTDAATRIQAQYRGKAGRCSARARQQVLLAEERARVGSEEEHSAATMLQALQRGRATRERMAAEQRVERQARRRERIAVARRKAKRAARRAAQARLHSRDATDAEHHAATQLQAVQRGRLARRRMAREAEEHQAATRLQAVQRGRLIRRHRIKEQRAATKIQARQRGRQDRRAFARRPDVLLREMTAMAERLNRMENEFSVRCWGLAPLGQSGT